MRIDERHVSTSISSIINSFLIHMKFDTTLQHIKPVTWHNCTYVHDGWKSGCVIILQKRFVKFEFYEHETKKH
jgi:hypothetical protein